MSPKIKFGTLFAVKTEAADNAVDYGAPSQQNTYKQKDYQYDKGFACLALRLEACIEFQYLIFDTAHCPLMFYFLAKV